MVLALGDLLSEAPQNRGAHAVAFVLAYLGVALGLLLLQYVPRLGDWRVPLAADVTALGFFLVLTHSVAAFWFVYLFVALAAGTRWGLERSIVLAGAVTLAVLFRVLLQGGFGWTEVFSWVALVVGTFTAGAGLSFMGDRQPAPRRRARIPVAANGSFADRARRHGIAAADARRTGARLQLRKSYFRFSRCGTRARARVVHRYGAAGQNQSRKFAAGARRRVSAGPARGGSVLESYGRRGRWIRLEPPRWPPPERIAPHAGRSQAGAASALDLDRAF